MSPLARGEISQIDNRIVVLSCPWFLTYRSIAVQCVSELYEWRESGGLNWSDVPVFARRAVTAFARGISSRQSHELEKIRKENESKRGGK